MIQLLGGGADTPVEHAAHQHHPSAPYLRLQAVSANAGTRVENVLAGQSDTATTLQHIAAACRYRLPPLKL